MYIVQRHAHMHKPIHIVRTKCTVSASKNETANNNALRTTTATANIIILREEEEEKMRNMTSKIIFRLRYFVVSAFHFISFQLQCWLFFSFSFSLFFHSHTHIHFEWSRGVTYCRF